MKFEICKHEVGQSLVVTFKGEMSAQVALKYEAGVISVKVKDSGNR